MTVSALITRNDITATASQTSFAYTFRVLAATDMDVYQNGVLLSSGYTVNNVGTTTGGTVVLDTGVPVGQIVSLVLAMPLDRTTNYQNSGKFLADDVNEDFDKIYIGAIQNENLNDRSLRLKDVEPPTSGVDMTIPLKADRLGKFLSFNATTGAPEVSAGTGADAYDSAAWSAYNFTGNGSTTAFALGIVPHSENNTQVYIDGVYQQKDGYSLSASTITFSVAPPNLSTIEVMVTASLAVGSTSSDLVSYTPAGTGAVATTVQAKLRESVSVKDFGAVGDGVTDDTAAFTSAFAASNNILIPSGHYIISSTLYFSTHSIVGAGSKSPSTVGTLITMTGNMPLFEYDGAYEYGTVIKGIFINYGESVPSSGSTKIGINIPNVAAWPAFYEFCDLRIRGAHIGVNDAGAAWHGLYNQVWAEKCRIGFLKSLGTDMVYNQCYAHDGFQAWDLTNIVGVTLNSCAMDANTDPDAVPIFRATGCTGLLIEVMDQEINVLSSNGNSMMFIDQCKGFRISGIGVVNNKISPIAGENYYIRITGSSVGRISEINTSTLTYDKVGGGTTVYIILADTSASVEIENSYLAGIVQTTAPSATIALGQSASASLTHSNVFQTDGTFGTVYAKVLSTGGVVSQAAFNTSSSTTVALVAATAVSIVNCNTVGAFIVTCFANNGNNTIYQSTSLVINDGSLATITSLKAGTNLVLTLSGTTVQATSSGTTTGSYSMIRLY